MSPRRLDRRCWMAAAALASFAGACGGAQAVEEDEVSALLERIETLERQAGRATVQIEEMEERIFLLQDRVDAARVAASRRHDSDYVRSVVTIGPGAQRPVAVPTAAAPPPYPEIDPLASMPALPVQRVGPAAAPQTAAPVEPGWDDVPEVVITNETLEARYGTPADSGGARSSTRSAAAGPRNPQPPVDVGGARLPTSGSPGSSVATPTAGRSAVSPSIGGSGARANYDRALDQFNAGQYAEALQSLTAFVESGPAPDYMDNALFWMGECYYGLGRYNDALGYFQRVVSEYPDGNKVPDSLLKVALSYERLDNVASAREVLSVVVDTYPATDAARRASERLQSLQ
jgi:tol-pal system protein YbgF